LTRRRLTPYPRFVTLLRELAERGRAHWPGLEVPVEELAKALGPELPDGVHAEDLYLAVACARGVRGAVEAFEQQYLGAGALTAALRRIDGSPAFLDEVRQAVREKLFVPGPGRRARIGEYSGRGSLMAWTRVVAVRTALDLRPRHSEKSMSGEGGRAAERDPELRFLQQKYGKHFEEAVASSFARLDDEQSNLLRLQIVDGLGTSQLASLFRVDRSTIKRRLAECRETMLQHTKEALIQKLGLSPSSFESLARLLTSQLHLSVARLLKQRG
jgi:RNA polymerase sigma-70 factor (ECF subfamily)